MMIYFAVFSTLFLAWERNLLTKIHHNEIAKKTFVLCDGCVFGGYAVIVLQHTDICR